MRSARHKLDIAEMLWATSGFLPLARPRSGDCLRYNEAAERSRNFLLLCRHCGLIGSAEARCAGLQSDQTMWPSIPPANPSGPPRPRCLLLALCNSLRSGGSPIKANYEHILSATELHPKATATNKDLAVSDHTSWTKNIRILANIQCLFLDVRTLRTISVCQVF